jgi:[acyl-carrier-protein] S-malonyltransferase
VIAFMFIGQGSALPWVGRDVLDDEAVAPLLEVASECSGIDVHRLLTVGGRELTRTEVEQPAMVAVCLGVHRMLERAGLAPDLVMGHSLGEVTAVAAAGGIGHESAVRIAALRGRLMAREATRHPGGLVRVTGDRDVCELALKDGRDAGSMGIAAHNGDNEWVLGGDEPAIARVIASGRATRLPIAGPWHTPAIAGAVGELRSALSSLSWAPLRAKFIANRDGSIAEDTRLIDLLVGQLIHPVLWVDMMRTAKEMGVTRYIAVGPGKTLRAIVHRNLGPHHPVEIIDCAKAVAAA